ncbi:MAG: hypothetical protein WCH76_03715, partial [Candidatus Riflemargulisbacteria bacterium]
MTSAVVQYQGQAMQIALQLAVALAKMQVAAWNAVTAAEENLAAMKAGQMITMIFSILQIVGSLVSIADTATSMGSSDGKGFTDSWNESVKAIMALVTGYGGNAGDTSPLAHGIVMAMMNLLRSIIQEVLKEHFEKEARDNYRKGAEAKADSAFGKGDSSGKSGLSKLAVSNARAQEQSSYEMEIFNRRQQMFDSLIQSFAFSLVSIMQAGMKNNFKFTAPSSASNTTPLLSPDKATGGTNTYDVGNPKDPNFAGPPAPTKPQGEPTKPNSSSTALGFLGAIFGAVTGAASAFNALPAKAVANVIELDKKLEGEGKGKDGKVGKKGDGEPAPIAPVTTAAIDPLASAKIITTNNAGKPVAKDAVPDKNSASATKSAAEIREQQAKASFIDAPKDYTFNSPSASTFFPELNLKNPEVAIDAKSSSPVISEEAKAYLKQHGLTNATNTPFDRKLTAKEQAQLKDASPAEIAKFISDKKSLSGAKEFSLDMAVSFLKKSMSDAVSQRAK